MRVAVDATPLFSERTGVGVFTAGALGALAERDDVELVAYALTWAGRGRLPGLLPPGARASRVPMAARPLHLAWRRFDWPRIEWFCGPVAVVHGTNFVVPPSHRAAGVVTIHDLTYLRFPQLVRRETLRAFPALVRRALARGAMVHTPSHAVADEVVEMLGVPQYRVRVVYHGVDAVSARGDDASDRGGRRDGGGEQSVHPPTGRPYVLTMARAEPRKDLPRLVAAFDAIAGDHPDLDLVLAGPAGWGEDALGAALERATHRSQIRRVGWVSPAQRATLLRHATVFAYPSVYEGFGLPPLEAMTAGVPVVATAAAAVAEVVGDAAKLVPVGDTDALAMALSAVVDDERVRNRLTDAGRRRVATFTWDRCAAGLYQLYADAVTAHSG